MKVYNSKHENLTPNLQKTLGDIRQFRGFNPKKYIQAKSYFLNEYLQNSGLSACVVAVSGGIDSAVVLSLVAEASKQKDSPIKQIVPISLPVLNSEGATNQNETISKAQSLCEKLGLELKIFDVKKSFEQIYPQVEAGLNQKEQDNWARGQLVAYARTPFLYYTTSVLSAEGFSSVIVGTTNRDEGAYLGYVGKASDGMVDVQLISDLHKSEVYAVGRELGVVGEIMSAIPAGDMYDGRVDEEVFGAPYDFVELYLTYKNLSLITWEQLTAAWLPEDFGRFSTYSTALEKLHKYNQHKYWSGSQAVHLDVIDSAVKDGWIEGVHTTIHKRNEVKIIPTHRFVGFVDQSPNLLMQKEMPKLTQEVGEVKVVSQLLNPEEVEAIINWRNDNVQKMVRTNEYGRVENGQNGSNRLSFYSEEFTKIIAERLLLSGVVNNLAIFEENDKTNWHPNPVWRFVGVNPMVRLLEYTNGDYLVPHYDDSFYESKTCRSLITLVMVISNDCDGGATRFLKDKQDNVSFNERDFSDWNNCPEEKDISFVIKPTPGSALLFPHRVLHDGEKVENGSKIILRTELMFEVCSSNFLKG